VRLEMGDVPNADSAQLIWFSATTDESSPMSKIIRGEAALQLCEALESLPDDQRIAVEMRYIEQQSLQAIAAVMDRSVGSVAGLIHRGISTLQARLPIDIQE
jgi:RNA polymerase sigma factor (sigma-70 family)